MFEHQHFVDLQERFGDSKSWLSGEDHSSPLLSQRVNSSLANGNGSNSNVDRVLYKNLVEMVPLVESLMDRRANASFTRRASIVYTKTPSKEPYPKRIGDPKGRKAAQSIPTKKTREISDKVRSKTASQDVCSDELSIFSSRAMVAEKEREELNILRKQVQDLEKKLSEKDELLKLAENSKNQIAEVQAKLEELRCQTSEKDSLIRTTHSQLYDVKIMLADKQAALEKLQWEAMTSNSKVDKLQNELDSMQGGISSLVLSLEGLTKNFTAYAEDYDVTPYHLDPLPHIDNMDDMEMEKMEEAREAYIAAISAAKEKQDEESIAIAAKARLCLQSFIFKTNDQNVDASKSFDLCRAPEVHVL
ncbi:PREDICTED: uncharacterized protein LOC104599939 [Nelumbo nucifera]|uniref:Uncharacterized protein LOC104599939 n=2 Tax=Nelumbo nucifera TaxID=4432 RepID=A0A1U8A7G4_NELNU|nr:PREDICTED: uncharacterized protein LOC104599939 [Nelumbo nucifera]DAD35114.1 TPA_asm: hypothetical protein HUJ06_005754 [Nelumbo nucifera]